MFAMMLFDQIGAAAALDGSDLAIVRPQVNHAGLEALGKLYRMKLQVFYFEEHQKTSATPVQLAATSPQKRIKKTCVPQGARVKSNGRGKQCQDREPFLRVQMEMLYFS